MSRRKSVMEESSTVAPIAVCLTWKDSLKSFSAVLQQGFILEARVNCSMSEILCEQYGVTREYLRERINTIFLDGKPVDDVDSGIIKDKSVLALSAAMPGFVGAAFRKSGFYAAMRREIKYTGDRNRVGEEEGSFILKLYNLVAEELGPLFLRNGILIQAELLGDFLQNRSEKFWLGCLKTSVDDREMELSTFRDGKWLPKSGLVQLRVVEDSSV